MKKRTGTVKLAELWVISGGNDGSGCARRIIAMVSPSSADEPDDFASRALSTPPVRLTVTREGEATDIVTKGRHDPCVGIRGAPVVEAMMALVLADQKLLHRAQCG